MVLAEVYCHTSGAFEDSAGNLHYFNARSTYEVVCFSLDIYTYDPQVAHIYGARDILSLSVHNMPNVIDVFWSHFYVPDKPKNYENTNKLYNILQEYATRQGEDINLKEDLGKGRRKRKNRKRGKRNKRKNVAPVTVHRATTPARRNNSVWPGGAWNTQQEKTPKTREAQRKATVDRVKEKSQGTYGFDS